jgi:hypothetical protein
MSGAKNSGIRSRLKAEAKKTLVEFVYLALLFGAFTTYRRMLLVEYHDSCFHFG